MARQKNQGAVRPQTAQSRQTRAQAERTQSVRPLDQSVSSNPHRPPRIPIMIALLAIGGLFGWGAASLGGDEATTTTSTIAGSDSSPLGVVSAAPALVPTVTWSQATAVPAIPAGMQYAGFSAAAELDDTTYVVVNYAEVTTDAPASELWSSTDGEVWQADAIWLGEPVSSLDLTSYEDSLLLSGTTDSGFGLWRSVPGRSIDGSSWNPIPLPTPEELLVDLHATRVSSAGRIVTMVIGNFSISDEIVAPYLPEGFELGDRSFAYRGDEFLYGGDGQDGVQIFAEPPEVLVTDSNVWIRIVTLAGEEVLQTVPLPDGVYPVDSEPTLADIPVSMMWRSDDGISFLPVTGSNALPEGYFLPEPWEDGFVAAVYEKPDSFAANEDIDLWTSRSGRAWQLSESQPPRGCSPFFFAVGREEMLLSGLDGTHCFQDEAGDWAVIDQTNAAAYVVGGGAGFIGYPNGFEYDQALFSADGRTWAQVTVPAPEPYPSLLMVGERLVALSVNRPRANAPTQIDLWIGKVGP